MAQADSTAPLPQKEVDSAVQQLEDAYVAAYNRGDAKGVAALYTETAVVIAAYGATSAGRAQIQRMLTPGFAQPSTRAKIEDKPKQSIAISKDVIITQGISRVTPPDSAHPPVDMQYTKVLLRQGDQWLIAGAQYSQPNPWTLTFSATKVGTAAASQSLSITNNGTTQLNISRTLLDGKNADEFGQTNTCTSTIPPSGSCSFTVTFTPKGEGRRIAELSYWDDANSGRHYIKLVGIGQ